MYRERKCANGHSKFQGTLTGSSGTLTLVNFSFKELEIFLFIVAIFRFSQVVQDRQSRYRLSLPVSGV